MSRKTAVQVPFVIGEFHELTGLTAPLRTTLHLPSTAPLFPALFILTNLRKLFLVK